MKPFKTLIVGVDFSDYSKTVVEQAFMLSKLWKAKVILVHALNEPVDYFASPLFSYHKPPTVKAIRDRIRIFYGVKDKAVKVVVAYDSPTNLIRSVAKNFSRRLILAGYKGQSVVTEMVFGSTARSLALGGTGPVWIHRGNKVIEPNRILVPHDLGREANRAIDLCESLKLMRPTTYDVFYVRERPLPVLDYSLYQSAEQQMVKQAQKGMTHLLMSYPKITFHSTTGNVTEKIVEKTKDFDLILLTHRKYRSFLSPSETSYLVKASNVPLLII